MKKLIVLLSVVLCACATKPVVVQQKWPAVPEELMTACPDLQKVPESTTELSDLITVVSDNYTQYKECKVKMDNWIAWYNTQQKIYESVK
jgi:hypothetical protein